MVIGTLMGILTLGSLIANGHERKAGVQLDGSRAGGANMQLVLYLTIQNVLSSIYMHFGLVPERWFISETRQSRKGCTLASMFDNTMFLGVSAASTKAT